MNIQRFLLTFIAIAAAAYSQTKALTDAQSSPFSIALDTLQQQIDYKFENIGLLRRAMTHASFSGENNKALAVLGSSLIETSVSLGLMMNDVEISAKDLNKRVSDVSNVETSCAVDGMRLGLQKVIRVSPKTDSTTPAVVCSAFRAIFGAIAVDTGSSDASGKVFWRVHGHGNVGSRRAISL